jgi:hypothetical protein
MMSERWNKNVLRTRMLGGLLAAVLLTPVPVLASGSGFVDGDRFLDICGDDCVTVEVNIPNSLLQALCRVDTELEEICGGLESIRVVILDPCESERFDDESITGVLDRVRGEMKDTESRLLKQGWERLVRVRDKDEQVTVLVLNDEEMIEGLTVMVVESECEMVFVNIAGRIDLAALQTLGEKFDVPGLDDLDLE